MKTTKSKLVVLPVLFGFFIMGFADVVGIATSYVKQDFGLTDSVANLLPLMVFLWFAVFSVPAGLLMNKLGRKNTVLVSIGISLFALLVPLISCQFTFILVAFALLGIGNTVLQVSLNPLLANIVTGKRLTSSLTLGQFVKAIASFSGPIIAGVASCSFGNWKLIFPFFAAVTLLSGIWLIMTPITEEKVVQKTSGFIEIFSLLKDPVILVLFIAIVFVVGIDVGVNTILPKFLMNRTYLSLEKAGIGVSLYFAARTIGTFVGAIFLMRVSGRKFYVGSVILGLASMVLLLFASNLWLILILIFCLGLAIANIFPIVFSSALSKDPEQANEVSGLLIMGVAGGAVVPLIMGIVSDSIGQIGAMMVLLFLFLYLLIGSLKMK